MSQPPIILASTSIYRQQLLHKLNLAFTTLEPVCDETPLANESAEQLVIRLAQTKAQSCHAQAAENAFIIGSDQVCVIDGHIIGKPLTHDNAVSQLRQASGRSITFYTGLALYNCQTQQTETILDTFVVHFRQLTDQQIENYLHAEQPYYCAGSFKSEGLGIALFKRLEGKDPNSLIGLPLISLIDLLNNAGIQVI